MATLLDFNQYEPETALLIAQLQLEDTLEISKGRKGKGRVDQAPSDEELAFRLASEEFGSMKQMYQDYCLAKSLNDAIDQDAATLEAHRVMEEAAAADRRAAELLSRGQALPQPTEAQRLLEDRTFKVDHPTKSGKTAPRAIVEAHPVRPLGEEEPLNSIWRFDDLSESLTQRAGPSVDRYKR
ncbi:hypothetical protein EST38_g7428 [Candolleomyces aberdarensis]|uniref:Uncharacterized protein n=1 Tax=Candolleomyces aberdarensis TaxID=2316362 RepID=A0A4Q2DF61_9AGAR|nr:hypothetical protein EST38_g7428 [Candolleomyces aberdarensis]